MPRSAAAATTAILDDLRRIVRALRESSRQAEGALGVSGAQLFVLKTLAEAPALSLNDLAARTRTHQSTVSVVVRRLSEAGFVQKSVSGADGRRIELRVSQRGLALLQRAPFAAQDRLIAGVESLSAAQRQRLAEGLRQLTAAMHLEDESPEMFFEDNENATRNQRSERRRARA